MVIKKVIELMMGMVVLFWGGGLNCAGQTTGQLMVISVRSTAEEQQGRIVKTVCFGALRLNMSFFNEDYDLEALFCSFVLPKLIAKPDALVLAYSYRKKISLIAMGGAAEKTRHRRHIIPIRSIKKLAQRTLLLKMHRCVLVSLIVLPIVILAIAAFLLRK